MKKFKALKVGTLIVSIISSLLLSNSFNYISASSNQPIQGDLRVLTYNVAGLSSIIQGGNPGERHSMISPKLNDYDIVGVQENFDYDRQLTESITKLPYRNIHTGKTGNGNGLNVFSKYRIHTARTKTWFYRFGNLTHGADENTPKGFSMSEVELAPNVFIHVYNLHADAGSYNSDFTKDTGSGEARRANIREVVEHIEHFSKDKAVILMGDTNAYYFRDSDQLKESFDKVGLKDAIVEYRNNGLYPEPVFNWVPVAQAMSSRDDKLHEVVKDDYETVDKILFRSGKDVILEVTDAEIQFEKFSFINNNGERERISDHSPVFANLKYTIDATSYKAPRKVYLSDYKTERATSGWGYFKPDSSVAALSHSNFNYLSIQNKKFSKGLGVHAASDLVYNINNQYKTFSSYIGIDDEVSAGRVIFQVWGDGKKLYTSPEIVHNTPAQKINVDITGVNVLTLKVLDVNGHSYDHADWGEAMLLTADYKDPGEPIIVASTDPAIKYNIYGGAKTVSSGTTRIRRSDAMNLTADWYDNNDQTPEDFADNRAASDAELHKFYSRTDLPSIEYTFTGTGIDYVGQKDFFNDNEWYSQRPNSITRVYIDGEYYRDVHINITESELWDDYTFLEIRDLPYGTHTIKLEKITGEWMVLNSFRVYGAPITLMNDNQSGNTIPGLTLYGKSWRVSRNRGRGDINNDVTESNNKEAYFTYRFYGTGVDFIAPTDSSNGKQLALIDGQYLPGTFFGIINTHANRYTAQQVLASVKNLERGWHTLTIKNFKSGGSHWFRIDGFRVYQ